MNFGPIASITPLALGVAISPLPVVGILVLLLTKGARVNSLVMLACWVVGNMLTLGVAVLFAGRIPQPRHGTDMPAEWLFALAIGLALIAMAAISWFGRKDKPGGGEPPAWLSRVDDLTPWGGAVIAFSNATTSPKNLALTLTAGVAIARTASPVPIITSGVYYVAVASTLMVIPVVFYFVGGERSVAVLTRWKSRITAHASAFIEIVLLVIGIAMTVRGLMNLLG